MTVDEHPLFLWLVPAEGGAPEEQMQRLRRDLVRFLAGRRCEEAEDLASEVLVRLTEKLAAGTIRDIPEEERKTYVFGMARMVHKEWQGRRREVGMPEESTHQASVPPADFIREDCEKLIIRTVQEHLGKLGAGDEAILRELLTRGWAWGALVEIGRQRGMQLPAVRQKAHRARERFARLLSASARLNDIRNCLGMGRIA